MKNHCKLAVFGAISYSRGMKKRLFNIALLCTVAWLACWGPAATAALYTMDDDSAGSLETYNTRYEDNLYELARKFDVGLVELLSANPGVDVWQPKPSTRLIVPTAHILPEAPRKGIVINLAELRLYYYPDAGSVYTFPIGIGREGWQTPAGEMRIVRKKKDPVWVPPPSIRKAEPDLPEVVPAGPDNPMGAYALYLGTGSYAIHGTNRPYGIGKRSSHGCIRMYPEDIETLFNVVKEGTHVRIIDKPYAIGWRGDKLYLNVMRTQEQADVISEEYTLPPPAHLPELYDAVKRLAGSAAVDWYAVEVAIGKQSSVPVLIAKR